MDREEFKEKFGASGPVILPVIHVLESKQAWRNINSAIAGGCPVFF
jgi:uncharacterized protein